MLTYLYISTQFLTMLNINQIKLIAFTSMVIDHIGLLFFPHIVFFRIIGRLAFPLFAWLIARGAHHTHDLKKYMIRLGLLALISQIPYSIFIKSAGITHFQLNVVFTLLAGLFTIFLINKTRSTLLKIIITTIVAIVTFFVQADYAIIGVISIVLFYTYQHNIAAVFWTQLVACAIWVVFFPVFFLKSSSNSLYFFQGISYQLSGVMSIVIIALQSKGESKKSQPLKYTFYALYPLHFLVLLCLRWFI